MRILLVEDDALIGLDVEFMLQRLGHEVVGLAASVEEAVARLAAGPDFVVLDLNLGQGPDFTLAGLLRERGIPFVLASGYQDARLVPDDLKGVPCLDKPFTQEHLARALDKGLAWAASKRPSCRPPAGVPKRLARQDP